MNHESILHQVRAVNPVPIETDPPAGAIDLAFVRLQVEGDVPPDRVPLQPSTVWKPRRRRGFLVAAATFGVVLILGLSLALVSRGPGSTTLPPATTTPTTTALDSSAAEDLVAKAMGSLTATPLPGWSYDTVPRPPGGVVDLKFCYEQFDLGIDTDPNLDLGDLTGSLAASALSNMSGQEVVRDGRAHQPLATVEVLAFASEAEAVRVEGALRELLTVGRNRICVGAWSLANLFGGVQPQEVESAPTRALQIEGADYAMAYSATYDGPLGSGDLSAALAAHRDGNLIYAVSWRDLDEEVDVDTIAAIIRAVRGG